MISQRIKKRLRRCSRGYALPTVLLVAMAGGSMVAIMLQRSGVAELGSRRQRVATVEHHLSAGVQEMAAAWLGAVGNLDLASMLDEDGLACVAQLDGRRRIEFRFEDAQGSLNLNPALYSPSQLEVLEQAAEFLGGPDTGVMTRRTGPRQVNVNSAPMRVLVALCSAVLQDAAAGVRVADTLDRARQGEPIGRGEARTALNESGVEDASDVLDWLVFESSSWRVRAELFEPAGPGRRAGVTRVYTGIATSTGDTGGSLPPQAMFSEWRELKETSE